MILASSDDVFGSGKYFSTTLLSSSAKTDNAKKGPSKESLSNSKPSAGVKLAGNQLG